MKNNSIKEHLQKVHQNPKNKKYQLYTEIVLGLIILLAMLAVVGGSYHWSEDIAKIIGVLLTGLALILNYLAFQLTKSYYAGLFDENSPLFIPKVFGVGITINPYNKIGRLIWIGLGIFIFFMLIWMIVSIF